MDRVVPSSNFDWILALTEIAIKNGALLTFGGPFKLTATLVKLGYIPKSLSHTELIGGTKMYAIPSLIDYIRYVVDEEGVVGLTRGQFTGGAQWVLYQWTDYCVMKWLEKHYASDEKVSFANECVRILAATAFSSLVGVLLSQPLAVLSVRQISQFVGKETVHSTMWALKNALFEPGFLQFLDTIIPRYLYLMIPAFCRRIAVRAYEHFMEGQLTRLQSENSSSDPIAWHFYEQCGVIKTGISLAVEEGAYALLYPLDVVFVGSSVISSGVVVGAPPFLPECNNWILRAYRMAKKHELTRGASVFTTLYTEHSEAFVVY